MIFQWSDEIAIGVEAIDAGHRRLVDIIGRFHEGADHGSIGAMRDALARLRRHAVDHFALEEELQRKAGYPKAAAHAAEHRDMLLALDALARRLASTGAAERAETLREETSTFLIQWLTRHVLGADLVMVPYAGRMRDAQRAAPPAGGAAG